MSGELSEWEETIATYRHCHQQLVRLAVVLLERGEDLTGLKETIYDLDENQAKDIFTVSVAEMAYYWRDYRGGGGGTEAIIDSGSSA